MPQGFIQRPVNFPAACYTYTLTHSHTLHLDAHETLQLYTLTVYAQIHTHTMEPSVLIIENKSHTNNMQRESLSIKNRNINLTHDTDIVTSKDN